MSDFTRAAAGIATVGLSDADGEADDADGLGDALVTDGAGLEAPGVAASESQPDSTPDTTSSPASPTATAARDLTRPAGIRIVRCSMRPFPGRPSSAPQGNANQNLRLRHSSYPQESARRRRNAELSR